MANLFRTFVSHGVLSIVPIISMAVSTIATAEVDFPGSLSYWYDQETEKKLNDVVPSRENAYREIQLEPSLPPVFLDLRVLSQYANVPYLSHSLIVWDFMIPKHRETTESLAGIEGDCLQKAVKTDSFRRFVEMVSKQQPDMKAMLVRLTYNHRYLDTYQRFKDDTIEDVTFWKVDASDRLSLLIRNGMLQQSMSPFMQALFAYQKIDLLGSVRIALALGLGGPTSVEEQTYRNNSSKDGEKCFRFFGALAKI